MSDYEFADELGLKMRDTYPVRRGGKKVHVSAAELTVNELVRIQRAVNRIGIALADLALTRSRADTRAKLLKMTPAERDEYWHDGQIKVRGRWRTWQELTPDEQAEVRKRDDKWLHDPA